MTEPNARRYFSLSIICLQQLLVLCFVFTSVPLVQAKFVPGFAFEDDQPVEEEAETMAGTAAKASPGRTWIEPVTGMAFAWVPAGCFQMGGNHNVCLDGFWIGKYEVTQGQWKKIMGSNPSHFKKGNQFPVETVSWKNAKKFISTLSRTSNRRFTLPSEAQWEYAARSAGKNEEYSGGDDPDRVGWYSENSKGSTHEVGTKAPNGLGLYDMSGNLWEWCEDGYDDKAYSKYSGKNPMITSAGDSRVVRGGSWESSLWVIRAAFRGMGDSSSRSGGRGFRLVCLLGQQ